jgi:ribosomal protein L11 methyltransferase
MELHKLTFTCPPQLAEIMATALQDKAVSVAILGTPEQPTRLVEAVYTSAPDIKALTLELSVLAALQGLQPPKLKLAELPPINWVQKVAQDHPPLPIGRWLIHSRLHRQQAAGARHPIQIDVTNAFGTGEHPTTRGCLLMLDQLLKREPQAQRWRMADIGCGTAILSMAFARATHGSVLAVDMDPAVVATARENIQLNGLQSAIRTGVSRGLSAGLVKRAAPFDLIMANIFLEPLCRMAKDVKAALKPGGYAIISGILHYQANGVLSAYQRQGLRLVQKRLIKNWAVFLLRRD